MKRRRDSNEPKNSKDSHFLADLIKKDSVLKLNEDTYAMSFKAFNYQVVHDVELDTPEIHGAFHAALMVFGIQTLMFLFIFSNV